MSAALQLSLMEETPAERADPRSVRDRWLEELRAHVLECYAGCRITTDDVWREMLVHPELRVPDGVSTNVLGSFFYGWKEAERTKDYRRSERRGAHRNLLTVWRIAG